VYKEKELIITLYRNKLGLIVYNIQVWRPYRKKNKDILERIQRRADKILPKMTDHT